MTFFFYQTEIYLNCVLHVLLSIDYMLSNCCLLQCLPPLLSVSPETTSVTCQQRAQWQTIDCPFSECPLPLYPTIEIDKCIGYWLSPMPTSTSIHPFPGPLPCPLSTSCPAGGGVSLAGLGARQATSGLWRAAAPRPSPCSLAPAGVSSGSSGCQSDLTPTERKKKLLQAAIHAILLCKLDSAAKKKFIYTG